MPCAHCRRLFTVVIPPFAGLLAVLSLYIFFYNARAGEMTHIAGFPEGFHSHVSGADNGYVFYVV